MTHPTTTIAVLTHPHLIALHSYGFPPPPHWFFRTTEFVERDNKKVVIFFNSENHTGNGCSIIFSTKAFWTFKKTRMKSTP